MRIDIITVLPKMFDGPLNQSIMQRAQDAGLVEINIHNLRDYSTDKQKSVDDYQYGGGAGMVLMIEPIANAINSLQKSAQYDEIIYLSPDGELLNQGMANKLSTLSNLILLCGHYKGIDERVRQNIITKEISVGDYVLSGGELAAAVLTDSIVRLIPGAISDETSALTDSFQDGMLAPPVYTRPAEYEGHKVPDVLLSGHEGKINKWREEQAEKRTEERRPDLNK
ncbi:MAG TPA: tRNA (guanosine(37)-N1)-methyltransferase TrmD [Flavobacteriales bacterium]|nr:tRNA (guanosine(37)-N1)-methyltransferase TrmD [Flavobacteriales bacterium]